MKQSSDFPDPAEVAGGEDTSAGDGGDGSRITETWIRPPRRMSLMALSASLPWPPPNEHPRHCPHAAMPR